MPEFFLSGSENSEKMKISTKNFVSSKVSQGQVNAVSRNLPKNVEKRPKFFSVEIWKQLSKFFSKKDHFPQNFSVKGKNVVSATRPRLSCRTVETITHGSKVLGKINYPKKNDFLQNVLMDAAKAVFTNVPKQKEKHYDKGQLFSLNVRKRWKEYSFPEELILFKSVFRHVECSSEDPAKIFKAKGLKFDAHSSKAMAGIFFQKGPHFFSHGHKESNSVEPVGIFWLKHRIFCSNSLKIWNLWFSHIIFSSNCSNGQIASSFDNPAANTPIKTGFFSIVRKWWKLECLSKNIVSSNCFHGYVECNFVSLGESILWGNWKFS